MVVRDEPQQDCTPKCQQKSDHPERHYVICPLIELLVTGGDMYTQQAVERVGQWLECRGSAWAASESLALLTDELL